MTVGPFRSRVDPWGRLHAVRVRGDLMGNRGRLHNERQEVVREFDGKRWIACSLTYKGTEPRKGKVFTDSYSELFFLDEATAFAAGHRPCHDCRKVRYDEFKIAWLKANSSIPLAFHGIAEIDRVLHDERIGPNDGKTMYMAELRSLPSGTFIEAGGAAYLIWNGGLRRWSFEGYKDGIDMAQVATTVPVLTPRSIVRMFSSEFVPEVDCSAMAELARRQHP